MKSKSNLNNNCKKITTIKIFCIFVPLLLFIITGCSSNTTIPSDFYGVYCTSDHLSTENCFKFEDDFSYCFYQCSAMSLYNDYSLQALNSCIDRIESGDKSGSCGDYSYSDDVITLSNGKSYNINYDNPSGDVRSISNSSAVYYKK